MIKLNDLAIGYNGEAILEHIDQEFDDGLIYGILAKSGAGKTTLLKTIAGLLRPVHGKVIIDGTTYRNADKNPVYMMHQRYSNFGWLSCTENVLIAQRDKKLRNRNDAIKVLAAVGLEQYADKWPSQLSGGMQQRLALARTLYVKPRYLLMDEPLSALDDKTRSKMQRLILDIHAETGNTIIMVTHSQDEAFKMCDKIIKFETRGAVTINDATASSNALITGELNAAGYTTNRTAFLSGKFQEAGLDVVMPVFTNYSAGGDGIIAKSGINTVNDLLGKKIGVPRFSEAQTLVAWFVNKSDLSDADKQSIIDNMILFDDASETGEAFFAGQLDVAATWQPYLSYATENSGAHIMFSTTASKSLIMDGIVFRSDFAQAHPDVVTAFIDGIFQANAMYTTEFDYIRSVMPMFAGVSDEEIKAQCGDAEMMGYAENKEVLDSTAPSVYFDMCDIWESLGETVNRKAAMTLFDNQYLLPLASKYSSTSASTSKPVELTEEQKQEIVNYEALLSKSMTVEFVADTAQFKNPEEAYAIMDEFVSIANTLDGAIIQVEGNINARNYSDSGQALSAERAKAVAKYFIACGIDPNRLITVGNGNTKMVADPGSADAYLNRRTDVFFKIIEE